MLDAAWLEIPDFTIRIVAVGCLPEHYVSLTSHHTAYLLYTFPVAGGFLTRLCRFGSHNRHELQTPVHPFPDRPDHLSHRKRCQNRSDSKSIQMSQEEDRHAGGHRQADHIKRYLYVGIRHARNVCCGIFSRSRPNDSKLPFYDTFSVNFCISFSSETFSINAPSSDSF